MKTAFGLFLMILTVSFPGHTATVTVSGGSGLQAAINSANPGDVVEITDSQTYSEDVFINKALTVRGADGQRPTIVATNTSTRGRLGEIGQLVQTMLGGSWNADNQGLYIESDNVTLSNLVVSNPAGLNNPANAVDVPAALTIVGDHATIDNCEISASPNGGQDDCAVFVGEGDLTAFTGSPYAGQQPQTTNNLKIQNCQITDGRRGIYVPDIGAMLSDISQAGSSQVRLRAENALVSNTTIEVARRAYQPIGAKSWTFQDSSLKVRATNNQDAIRAQGGSTTFINCFIGSPANRSINCQAFVAVGGGLIDLAFDHCTICGGGNNGEQNLIDDANLAFSHCIVSSTGPNPTAFTFQRRVSLMTSGISFDFLGPAPYADAGAFPGRETLPTSFTFQMDHCDVYNPAASPIPWRTAIMMNELAPEFSNAAPYSGTFYFSNHVILTNSIITADIGLMDGTQMLPVASGVFGTEPPFYSNQSSVVVLNNIFNSKNGDPDTKRVRLVSGNGYTVNGVDLPYAYTAGQLLGPDVAEQYTPNFLDRDPLYPAIGKCNDPAGWLPGDETLRTAGTDGSPVGSQLEPVSNVLNWNLY